MMKGQGDYSLIMKKQQIRGCVICGYLDAVILVVNKANFNILKIKQMLLFCCTFDIFCKMCRKYNEILKKFLN